MCVCVVCVVSVCVWVCVCPGISSIIAIIPVFIFLWFFFVLLYFSFVQHFLSLTIVFVIFYNTHFCVTFSISLFLVILSILWYFDILWFCLTFFPGPQFPSVLSVVWTLAPPGGEWTESEQQLRLTTQPRNLEGITSVQMKTMGFFPIFYCEKSLGCSSRAVFTPSQFTAYKFTI